MFQESLRARASLPIAGLRNNILRSLDNNDVILVCGETGSGKTTQVPQFILDELILTGFGGFCNILCTQPRRIAAISVAERVSSERCEPPPGTRGSFIGYQVRLQAARNDNTKLCFCTTGILLRKLAGDKNLDGVTHVIIDEVHERSILGDFLLIILKKIIEKQVREKVQPLKVILMSATVDSNLFSSYFSGCPVIHVEGRTHPVANYYLEDVYECLNYVLPIDSPVACGSIFDENDIQKNYKGKKNFDISSWGDDILGTSDCGNPHFKLADYASFSEQTQKNLKMLNEKIIDYDLLEDLVAYIDDTYSEGAMLIFMPGLPEINLLADRLVSSYRFGGSSADWIFRLHSSIAPSDQKKIFLRPPEGVRKIIISTNIAETSVTIDDVVYVIDCGKHKENRYNPHKKLSCLTEEWISRANARQRRGRAGRVKPGICFCLYTRYRYEKLMRPYQTPEMLRMPLVELCLQIKLLSMGRVKDVLSKALDPPKESAVENALSLLYEVGGLEGDESLTPLGHLLAKLPVDVLIGKMMIFGAIFRCLSPILSIAAFLSYKSPFLYSEQHNLERAKVSLLSDSFGSATSSKFYDAQSDHIVMMLAYQKWANVLHENGVKAAQNFCKIHYLSSSVMYMIRDMRVQFGTLLADIGFFHIPNNEVVGKRENIDLWLSNISRPFNMLSHHPPVLKAVLCAGLYPNIAATEEGVSPATWSRFKQVSKREHPIWYDGRREIHIHPTSINATLKTPRFPFIVFLEKVETNKVFVRDCSVVSPYSILLFGGQISIQHQKSLATIDEWLKLSAPAQTAVLFNELRKALHSFFKKLIQNPMELESMSIDLIKSVVRLLLDEESPAASR